MAHRLCVVGSFPATSTRLSRIDVPPADPTCPTASMIVFRSPVGPVSAPRRRVNGATST